MLIISDLRGQLCNRIFITAYGLSLQQLTGRKFLNFSLDKYASLFPHTRRASWTELPYQLTRYAVRAVAKAAWLLPIARALVIDVTWANSAAISPMNPAFIARLKRRPLTFLRIAQYFDLSKLAFPDLDIVRHTFAPDPAVTHAAQAHARLARGKAAILVGLHIRRRDYDVHLGGRHFYPLDFYRRAMDRMVALFPGQTVAFLLCSDDALPDDFVATHPATRGLGTQLGDLYTLAECDYLLGPPSTFSLWAAYYGRKPIHHMIRPEPPASLAQFMVPDGHFECYDLNTI
jgi:hypothetical protein